MNKATVKIVVVVKRAKNLWAGEVLHDITKEYEIMKTSHGRAYCTRLFNKELARHKSEPDAVIAATYYADYGPHTSGTAGRLSGRGGTELSRTGIFDQ